MALSREFLAQNQISAKDLGFAENDPRVAVVALGLVEYYETTSNITTLRASLGGCVLEGLGVKALVKGSAKVVARQIGKFVARKFIPYVGWGLAALDFANCMLN